MGLFDRDHPRYADVTVAGNPAQSTVDVSGDIYEGGFDDKAFSPTQTHDYIGQEYRAQDMGIAIPDNVVSDATVINLPHPTTREIQEGSPNFNYPDPIAILQHIENIATHLDNALTKLSQHESSQIKRRQRGPLRGRNSSTGAGTITVSFDPVPPGEIWEIERYTVHTATATVIRVFDGDTNDFTNQVDWTTLAENTADNASPIRLFPGQFLSFLATVPGIDTLTVHAQVSVIDTVTFGKAVLAGEV